MVLFLSNKAKGVFAKKKQQQSISSVQLYGVTGILKFNTEDDFEMRKIDKNLLSKSQLINNSLRNTSHLWAAMFQDHPFNCGLFAGLHDVYP